MSDINLALTESQSLRNQHISEINSTQAIKALEKAKALIWTSVGNGNIATVKECADYYEVSVDTIHTCIKNNREELASDGLRTVSKKRLIQGMSLRDIPEKTTRLTVLTPRSFLRIGLLLRDSLVAQEVRSEVLNLTEQKVLSDRESLEKSLLPKASLKEIDESATILGKRFGKLYEQRYIVQQYKKHQPHLLGDLPDKSEYQSLPSAKSWLTPTQLAGELGIKYSTGSPNPQLVNKLLESLGYQVKIQGQWSATEKSINANLCDRKPVNTNSRTQKDQLLWAEDIIVILSEHLTNR